MKTHGKRALSGNVVIRAIMCLFLAVNVSISPAWAFAETMEAVESGGVRQNVTITGVVKDKNGEPVIGANVLEKGTANGVITDVNGNFTMKLRDANATLVVSYIGFQPQEVKIGSGRSLEIVLSEDSELLDEIVVIGYGT